MSQENVEIVRRVYAEFGLSPAGVGAAARAGLIAALRKAPFDLGGYRLNFKPGGNSGSNYVEISVIGAGGRILN